MEKTMDVPRIDDVVVRLRRANQYDNLVGLVMRKLATRLRNRDSLTPGGLKLAMSKDDLNYPKTRYAEVLKVLASAGLGKLDLGPRGQIRGLHRIPVDLKRIGNLFMKEDYLEPSVQPTAPPQEMPPPPVPVVPTPPPSSNYVTLIVSIEGKKIEFPSIVDLDNEEVGQLIVKFFELTRKTVNR